MRLWAEYGAAASAASQGEAQSEPTSRRPAEAQLDAALTKIHEHVAVFHH